MNMAILITAAGNSSRLGQPKQLVNFCSKPLLQHCIDTCVALGPDVYCVLGAYASEIRQQVSHQHCRFLYNPTWQDGLSDSISFGIGQLPPDTSAVMIMLCDLWALTLEDLDQLVSQYQANPEKIHTGFYDGHQGAPTIFPKAFFPDLLALPPGSNGARSILKRHQQAIVAVPMPSASNDLDTPQQLQHLQSLELSHGHPFN